MAGQSRGAAQLLARILVCRRGLPNAYPVRVARLWRLWVRAQAGPGSETHLPWVRPSTLVSTGCCCATDA